MYLDDVLARLAARGHEIGLCHEIDGPEERGVLRLPPGAPRWSVETLGPEATREIAAWRPEVLFAHGVESPDLEEDVSRLAPVVFVAHAFHGTCISGTKAHAWPHRRPCERRFGTACLMQFYPRRCGGLNPVTMLRHYGRADRRLAWLRLANAVVTLSEFMRAEYVAHGLAPHRVHCVPYGGACSAEDGVAEGDADLTPASHVVQLLFVGRLEPLKGVDLLLEALPVVRRALGRPVCLTIAGDGRSLPGLRQLADAITAEDRSISVRFTGWVNAAEREGLQRHAHLLVIPSVWPEPFGLVGLEAAGTGLPAVAFAVGGINEWLHDGVTGRLADADPPTARSLGAAITWCLEETKRYVSLRRNARAAGDQFDVDRHVSSVEQILTGAAATP